MNEIPIRKPFDKDPLWPPLTRLWLRPQHEDWYGWISNSSNWYHDDEGDLMLCGNLTGARHCLPNYTCLCIGNNPNHGYTNFDNFMWSMVRTQHVLQSFAMSGSRNEFPQLFPGEIILNRFWQRAFSKLAFIQLSLFVSSASKSS